MTLLQRRAPVAGPQKSQNYRFEVQFAAERGDCAIAGALSLHDGLKYHVSNVGDHSCRRRFHVADRNVFSRGRCDRVRAILDTAKQPRHPARSVVDGLELDRDGPA
jgi:hypothetical protein